MKIQTIVIAIILALPSVTFGGEVTGVFQDNDGKNLKKFVILDLKKATKFELAAIFPKSCQPPLTYTKDGKFYCSKGTGPHQMKISSMPDRRLLINKLVDVDLIKLK